MKKAIRYGSLSYEQTANKIRVGAKLYPKHWSLEHAAQFKLYQEIGTDLKRLLKWFHRNYRKEFIFGSVLLLALIPAPHKVKALTLPTAPLYIHHTAPVEPVQPIAVTVPSEVAPVPEPVAPPPPPPPAAAPATVGCVAGVTVADYYENLLIQRESSGNSCADNGSCVGVLQACPSSKLYAVCPTLEVSCQLNFFEGYMSSTYGSWANAWAKDEARSPHWW